MLVARRSLELHDLARTLERKFDIGTEVHVADLSSGTGRDAVCDRLTRGDVEVLINNAGFATQGNFAELDAAIEGAEVEVNCIAVQQILRAAIPSMMQRRNGFVLNVASIGGRLPAPQLATYSATKAFVIALSVAVGEELRPHGVVVTALCPGPVRTEFFEALGSEQAMIGQVLPARQVAEQGLRAMFAGRPMCIPGLRTLDIVV